MTHTINEALAKFTLVSGEVGSEEDGTACPMALLSWIHGDPFSDHPECAHSLICAAVISATDAGTTVAQREELVRLGIEGALDTWWIPSVVIVAAMAAPNDELTPTPYERALRLLTIIAEWKKHKSLPNLANADLGGAYLANADLGGAYLANADLGGAYLANAYLANAYLANADLRGANLANAYLANAYLANADLGGAYLANAYLANADLRGANLANAKGDQFTKLPAGWKVNDAGLIVRAS